ncbi:MAG: hypothetical protein OXE78_08670 [Gammaproteobacteria bacterium]|nr:hypothetical protein [Gammaproteobacteria bacterium]
MQCQYRYLNQVPLNKSHPDLVVNFLEFRETEPGGKRPRYFWHKVRSMFDWWLLPDWETLYSSIAHGIEVQLPRVPGINSS